ncbi:MAG: hypothetical protein LBU73_06810 [Helicobacteraceae bacterium]|nr:hypothetical protein [Helicobacteraceae bacterium]
MRLDFLHKKLMNLSDEDARAIAALGAAGRRIASCERSASVVKEAILAADSKAVFEPIFYYGVAKKAMIDRLIAAGFTIAVEAQEIDSFFINDASLIAPRNLLKIRDLQIARDPTLQKTALDFFAAKKITPYLGVKNTLSNSLLIRLPNIKARDLVNTLALDNVFITNGEGCTLGLGVPSSVAQSYGFSQDAAREAISLSWSPDAAESELLAALEKVVFRYEQLARLA